MTSTSTKTWTMTEGNTKKTITETTVTKPDGSKSVSRQERIETITDGACSGTPFSMSKPHAGSPGPNAVSGGGAGGGAVDVSLKDFREQSLKAHNERRAKHQAPPLKMSDDLNNYAQNWAEHLVKTGAFKHSDCTLNGERLGENIANKWSSSPVDYTGEEAVQQWYSEISKHNFSQESNAGTGHFTQVVWKDSKELGMGKAKTSDGGVFVVGSYRPAGNMMGTYMKNVLPPK